MKWPADTKDFALPVRDADAGQPAEAAMRLGVRGIMTVEYVQTDGSIMRLSHRGGHPLYEIVEGGAGSRRVAQNYRRGFVAVLPGATTGTLFNPYTLAVVQHGFKPAGALYYVLDFSTNWNVSPSDTMKWNDVISFFANRILVNAMRMDALGIPSAVVPDQAIPYLITHSPSLPYGDSVINQTKKRIFAVGRSTVKAFSAGFSQVQLAPESARSEGRAVTVGQRTIGATHQAIMAQIYYAGLAFDAPGAAWMASWTTVQMALIAPILTAVNGSTTLDQPICPLNAGSSVPVSETTAVSLPPVELCAVGIAEGGATSFTPEGIYEMFQWVRWPARQTLSYAVPASKKKTGSRQSWSGSASASPSIAGVALTYSASNALTVDTLTESYDYAAFDAPLFSSTGGGTYAQYSGEYFAANGGYAVWPPVTSDLRDRSANGNGVYHHFAGSISTTASYTRRTQTGFFSVQAGTVDVLRIEYSRTREDGQRVTPTPIGGRFAALLADPYLWISPGGGAYEPNASCQIKMWSWDPTHPNVVGKRQIEITNKVAAIAGGKFFDNDNAYNSDDLYTGTVGTRPLIDERALSWITRDYLLLDEENGVAIVIKGQFVGTQSGAAQGWATLTVSVVVTTRYHEWSLQLLSADYTYDELLPEYEIRTTGEYAIPSPQIRAMFVPLHREQGSFKGAHYVTLDEENAGAYPAHLFSMQLVLHSFSDMGKVNEWNVTTSGTHFVPFNLLEMLYCFVFSQDYGVGASTLQRYPVTFHARYNDLMMNLFGVPFNVNVRDGVETPWTHSLHSSFVGVHGASLHRV